MILSHKIIETTLDNPCTSISLFILYTMPLNATLFENDGVRGDPTAFIKEGTMADFVLMKTPEIAYLCMFVYTFMHGESQLG